MQTPIESQTNDFDVPGRIGKVKEMPRMRTTINRYKYKLTVIEAIANNIVMDLKNACKLCLVVAWKHLRGLENNVKNRTKTSEEHGSSCRKTQHP
jgi:NADPH-dependent 7-cyano-7-deazaguanine reductase QueF